MLRRTLIKAAALAATSLTPPVAALAQPGAGTPETVPPGSPAATPASPTVETGYAPVNGLEMYFEIHGGGGSGQPLLMLHGGLATIGFPGGHLLPLFARSRPVIAIEQQGHGRTADIDRPLTYEQMVEDTAALIRHLGFAQVDVFGHSMGGTTALGLAIGHPDLVRKLVIVAAIFSNAGMRSENLAGMQGMTPEGLAGTPPEHRPMEAAYLWKRPISTLRPIRRTGRRCTASSASSRETSPAGQPMISGRLPRRPWPWSGTRTPSTSSTPSSCCGCAAATSTATSPGFRRRSLRSFRGRPTSAASPAPTSCCRSSRRSSTRRHRPDPATAAQPGCIRVQRTPA